MRCNFCSYISNLASRFIYTIFISLILAVCTLLIADTLLVTTNLTQDSFLSQQIDSQFTELSDPIRLETYYFKFQLPGVTQIATLLTGEQCLVYDVHVTKTLSQLPSKYHPVKEQLDFLKPYDIVCVDQDSYDHLKDSAIFQKLNMILIISAIVFLIVMIFVTLSIWLCCDGFCGCKCFKIFTICCDDNSDENTHLISNTHQI
ncbi:Transmembrane domain-containing protein [Spironucleus salmonicida]|uniref:Transmembrane domain-containing protein n=1 Tax=Spironucleus salmonicida TaxID=348837 RepID=V6LGK3_9EUKA|nr:Transmembrane domain-containing protein [Spironucleus salmonicida]|eukprot:EST43438.1 Transmembrane domain-containing protein [Spironucleus salmonicida]